MKDALLNKPHCRLSNCVGRYNKLSDGTLRCSRCDDHVDAAFRPMTDTQASDVVVTEAPVDGGFDGASVEAAETLWACLPHVRKWTSLATHEKALVIHTFARLSTQSAMQARIEKLEAALRFYADAEKWDDFAADQQASVFDRNFGSELGSDRGALARATLSSIGGSNDG